MMPRPTSLGPLLAVGYGLVAASHALAAFLVMIDCWHWSIGAVMALGGLCTLIGWSRAVGYRRVEFQAIGILGLLGGFVVMLIGLVRCLTSWAWLESGWFFSWFELAMIALAVAGAWVWNGTKSGAMLVAGALAGAYAIATFTNVDLDSNEAFVLGLVPAGAWAAAGIAVLAMRPKSADVPTAVVIR